MNEENKKKYTQVKEYFSSLGIIIPIDVGNSLEDAFEENDTIETVNLYFKDSYSDLINDLKISKNVTSIVGKPGKGNVDLTYTYYGEVDWSMSEYTNLYDENEKKIEEITYINNEEKNTYVNPDIAAIIVIEKLTWDENGYSRKPTLYIYFPQNDPEEDSEEENNNDNK